MRYAQLPRRGRAYRRESFQSICAWMTVGNEGRLVEFGRAGVASVQIRVLPFGSQRLSLLTQIPSKSRGM